MYKQEENKMQAMSNFSRYKKNQKSGHYESYFLRANHPKKAQAFWIRYTVFQPNNKPEEAIGELWAVYFDKDKNENIVVKEEFDIFNCTFANYYFDVKISTSILNNTQAFGSAKTNNNKIEWNLDYSSNNKALFLLPLNLYSLPLPKAKSLVPQPFAIFNGEIVVNDKVIDIKNWVGSQNHNWGSAHTDLYAWGQVAGFDNYENSFLEVATAQIKIGPFYTPAMTPIVLRHKNKEYKINSLIQTVKNNGKFDYFTWNFDGQVKNQDGNFKISGSMKAKLENFVGLTYYNPPGGSKYCLNTKIAQCKLQIIDKEKGINDTLETENRAAFEILTEDKNHGVDIKV